MKQSVRKIGLFTASIGLLVIAAGCGRVYQGNYSGGSVTGTINNTPLTGATALTTLSANGNTISGGSMTISSNGSNLTGTVSGGSINGDSINGLTVTLQNPSSMGTGTSGVYNPAIMNTGANANLPLSYSLMGCPATIILQCNLNFVSGQTQFNETCASSTQNCSIQFTVNSGTKS